MIYVYPMGAIRASQTFVKTNYLKINIDGIMHSLMSPCNLCSKYIFEGPLEEINKPEIWLFFSEVIKKHLLFCYIKHVDIYTYL